ncbi:MAG: 6-phosphofructokinase [Oscillospiraceae bacterium]|nr:6-phosphofructokinase [Oscillospiraceae bacterium]MBQ9110928.1 6-phosphofructokinase [Oscillospiraceae bacterium]
MNIAIAQSGGPTCAINASLVGVFKQGILTEKIDAIFGSINGIEGIINDDLVNLKSMIRTNEDMELLRQTPSTMLGSCRYKLPEYEEAPSVYEKILACFERHRIRIFVYIGGNDSMDTVVKLSDFLAKEGSDIRVIGVPKTIDNDLPVTDHTPGFGSAAKYVAATVQEIIRDSSVYSIPSVTVIEIMGRHSGWLAASSCMLRANGEDAPHLIYLPECEFSGAQFIEDVRKEMAKHKAVVVAVSEGVTLSDGAEGLEDFQSGATDNFGHKYLSGIGKYLERLVAKEIGCKVRSVELNVMQRCSSHICSKTDIDEAERIGRHALRAALDGETGKMMYFRRVSDMPYAVTIEMTDAKNVANLEKKFPQKWIVPEQNQVTDSAVKYFLPLIQGEVDILMRNGLPVHFQRPLQMR